ncbi:MAG: hypothetical protein ACF8TS_12570 [Maioricimonas sp. JB049]
MARALDELRHAVERLNDQVGELRERLDDEEEDDDREEEEREKRREDEESAPSR